MSPSSPSPWEDDLARLVTAPPEALFSDEALSIAGLALTDLVGVTLAGGAEPIFTVLDRYLATVGTGPATVIGRPQRLSPGMAAFANGAIGHVLDYDDSNLVMGGHPSVVLYPALLALAEPRGLGGEALLSAYAVGFEAAVRLARGINFHHYEKGWHPTATLGVFGAAAGAAHLLGLDAHAARSALALAATTASGLKAAFGTMAKPLQVGRAAEAGVWAASMAESGADAPTDILAARQGFFRVYNGEGNFLIEPPEWTGVPELLNPASSLSLKNYPCCGSTHVVIDTACDLIRETGLDPARIEAVEVAMNPRRIPHVNRPGAADPLQAKFSVQYTCAAALIDGAVGLGHFTGQSIARPDIRILSDKVRLVPHPSGAEALGQPCRLTVTLEDGARHAAELPGPRGRDPESYARIAERKFLDCAGRVLSPGAAAEAYAAVRGVRALADIRPLMARLAAPAAAEPLKGIA